jgi:hypothetical protein
VDLIVIGTHGRTGFSRRLLGSVAEAVIRTAPCLVMTVPAGGGPSASREAELPAAALPHCIVCAKETDDLICDPCRAHIRGEALAQKLDAERAGRRGAPA